MKPRRQARVPPVQLDGAAALGRQGILLFDDARSWHVEQHRSIQRGLGNIPSLEPQQQQLGLGNRRAGGEGDNSGHRTLPRHDRALDDPSGHRAIRFKQGDGRRHEPRFH